MLLFQQHGGITSSLASVSYLPAKVQHFSVQLRSKEQAVMDSDEMSS